MKKATLVAFSVAAVLAACGGSDYQNTPDTPATSEIPASASASVDGFIAYLKRLVVSAADMLEPVDTSAVTGPKDEVSEPVAVD